MKKLFFLFTILGLLCAACGRNTAQNDSHTHADETTHVHSEDCDHDHEHDHSAAQQERYVVGDQDSLHSHEGEDHHDHEHGEETHAHRDHTGHTP